VSSYAQAAAQLRAIAREQRAAGPRAEALAAKVVLKSLADIEADAKQLAPVDTGNLRNSISREITSDTFAGAGGEFGGQVGPTASYGAYVEYGTSRMRPQPYMGPAFTRRVPAFLAAMGKIPDLAMRRGR
jgi:HK97 gp10 family phage protein